MSSVVAQVFHNSVAEAVVNEITSGSARYYYYFGNTLDNLDTPEVPINSPEYIAKTRNGMIMLMRVDSNDVSYVVPRINWTSGTRYNKYESSTVGEATNFYVITDQFNVYKCLDNGAIGAVSTVKPTSTDFSNLYTADGYTWKFMYNVPLSLRNKFLSDVYMPVSNALRNRFYSSGEIDSVTIMNHGSGYVQASTTISVTGDGIGAELTPVISGGALVSVTIDNPGTGYTYATLTVNGVGTGASIVPNTIDGNINSQQAIVENLTTPGTIDSVSIINGGIGFVSAPNLVITGDGTGATGTVEITNGSISRIIITNPGINYSVATVTLTDINSGTGYILDANVSPAFGHGRDAVKELYASNLMFYGNMSGTQVAGFDIVNDYQTFGLVKNVRSTSYDLSMLDQADKKKYLIYTTDPVTGILIDDVVTTVGFGDPESSYTVTAIANSTSGNIIEVVPTGLAVVPPPIGAVFSDIIREINFTSSSVKYKPIIEAKTASFCYILNGSYSSVNFPIDTILTKGDKTFIIVAWGTNQVMIQPLDGGTLSNGDTLVKQSDITKTLTVSNVTIPTADKRTGDILTIDNRIGFYQSAEQAVSTRTVIKF